MLSRRSFAVRLLASAAPPLAGVACVRTDLTPPLAGDTPDAAKKAGLAGRAHRVGGIPMHSLVSNPEPPPAAPRIVLVHGLALSGRYMIPTADALAGRAKVRVPDLPGFGDSAKPDTILDVTGLADALAQWLREVVGRPVTLLGNSFGCQIIVELAARHPELVSATVLQGPTSPPDERTWLCQFIRWRQNSKYNPPEMGEIASADYEKCGILRALVTFHHGLNHQIEEKLHLVRAPSLVVRGSKDPICNQDWAELVAARLADGELAVISGVAHTLCYTAPVRLARVSLEFLSRRLA